jgi:hypothetical protein
MVGVQDETRSAVARPHSGPPARGRWWWVPGAITIITIVSVIVVTLSQMHPSLLLTDTTTTGGDTGAHIAMPKYLETLLSHGHATGWYPGWYDGMPLYTFYFTLPDLFIAVAGWIIPYNIAFKLVTVLGSVLLPITAWACGRFFRLRPPIPTLLAAATLPFLFDPTFTILGGNLFSTMAGEYAYSFSLALSLLFLGLFSCAIREGRYRGWAALVLALTVLSHIVGGLYALGGAAILTVLELLPRRWGIGDDHVQLWREEEVAEGVPPAQVLWRAASTVVIGLLLTAWWLVPFGLERSYATSMGYINVKTLAQFFPEADVWALVLAGLGVVAALILRSRFGLTISLLGIAFGVAVTFDPQGSLYNVRLLPLWFISVYLMAAWAFGIVCIGVAQWWRRMRDRQSEYWPRLGGTEWPDAPTPPMFYESAADPAWSAPDPAGAYSPLHASAPAPARAHRWAPAAVGGSVLGLLLVMAAVVPPFIVPASSLPVTLGANQVTNWSSYNYVGYEGQPDFPEYRAIIDTTERVSHKYGCGREMWEYSDTENRFGTPEALMLLPYWTNGCVDSMEGLLFESSATTPYHFINQAELSQGPSEPEVGLPYGPVNVTLGVKHLQLLGVKYFMAETPTVEQEANADPDLKLVAQTGPWAYNYNGTLSHTTWDIYLVRNAPLVTPLKNDPVVLSGVNPAPSGWIGPPYQSGPALKWYDDPSRWNVELAQSGPSSWPRTPVNDIRPAVKRVPTTRVTAVRQTDTSVSFHVSRLGTPVLVKVSYFPNWHASGADGPWRVTPNLMVVVPTSHDVTLSYGRSTADNLGQFLTLVGLVALIVLFVVPVVRRWRRPRENDTAEGHLDTGSPDLS